MHVREENIHMEVRTLGRAGATKLCYVWPMILAATFIPFGGTAYGQQRPSGQRKPSGQDLSDKQNSSGQQNAPGQQNLSGPQDQSGQQDLSEISKELTNPVSNLWSMFTEFDLFFSDGNIKNNGGSKVGGRMIFQPVLPFPLYGQGRHQWKLITRPTISAVFSQPVPKSFDAFTNLGGLGDMQLPLLVSPPTGKWLLGVGPTLLLPTATRTEFGRQQWGAGPAFIVGYKAKDWIAGAFPQYTWRIAGWNGKDKPDASYLSILYFFAYSLPNAWQIGFNPTINYDAKATSGNRWNVPVGLFVSKTTRVGNLPVKWVLSVEYSIVSQHAFGQRAQVKLSIVPVIPSLVKKAVFGGS